MTVPKYDDLLFPLFKAMHELGGSASIEEQEDKVATILKLSEKDISEIHRGNRTKYSYRLAWARTYLKRYGVLNNSSRGIWVLTPEGQKRNEIDKDEVKTLVQKLATDERTEKITNEAQEISKDGESCEEKVLDLIKSMPADGFERLCQRLLRESGFIQVEITGRSGDEGVDGKGVVRIGGLLSFHVIFQCKRYKGSVSPSIVRDFRGAMVGRADKGLLITTGTYTREARREAQRDGATPIDLIDGDDLVVKLKELGMGLEVKQKVVEEVTIQEEYFKSI